MPDSTGEILRQRETPKGSSIWDLARQNRDLVEKHTFWEIRGGEEAKFWEDRWQHKERISNIQGLQHLRERIEGDKLYVKDYWKANDTEGN